MDALTFRNNQGYRFQFSSEGGGAVRVYDKFGIDLGMAPHIFLNGLTHEEMKELEEGDQIQVARLVHKHFQNRLANLSGLPSAKGEVQTRGIQCYNYEGKPFVVLGKAGLNGGGPWNWVVGACGVAKLAGGILLVSAAPLSLFPLMVGSGCAAAGIHSMYFAASTPEEKITVGGYAKQAAVSFAGGAIGGGAGAYVAPLAAAALGPFAGPLATGAAVNVANTTGSGVAQAAIEQDAKPLKKLTPGRLAKDALTGSLTGGVTILARGAVQIGGGALTGNATNTLAKAAIGGAAGAASSLSSKAIDNLIKRSTFLQICNGVPEMDQIELCKLYVYAHEKMIVYMSVNDKEQLTRTEIKKQEDFQIDHPPEMTFDSLISVLKEGKSCSYEQKRFILESACKRGHVPVDITSGFGDAAVVGVTTGVVTVFAESMQKAKKVDGGSSSKAAAQKASNENAKGEQPSAQAQSQTPKVVQLEEKKANLQTLSQYTAVDLENVANEMYNDAKNAGYLGSNAVAYVEKALSDKYGIPIGTNTDLFQNACGKGADKRMPARIMNVLADQQATGSALRLIQNDLNQATALPPQNLNDPNVSETNAVPQMYPQGSGSFNIFEIVVDAENYATANGAKGNLYVIMRRLATVLAGADHGERYEAIYNSYYEASIKWKQIAETSKAPTQYGFLTNATDVIVNGQTTLPVELRHRRWYNRFLDAAGGEVGIGFQTDGETVKTGSMDKPDIITVYKPENKPGGESAASWGGDGPKYTAPASGMGGPSQTSSVPEEPSDSSGGGNWIGKAVNSAKEAVSHIDNIDGLKGLGSHQSNTINGVNTVLGFGDRMQDPAYQDAPFAEKVGCATLGTIAESSIVGGGAALGSIVGGGAATLTGVGAPAAPIAAAAGGAAGAALATDKGVEVGDTLQQACHNVIDKFR